MRCFRCDNWPCTCPDGQTIIHGDCREVLPLTCDAVITDPPYFRVKSAAWDRQWNTEGLFLEFIGSLCDQWRDGLAANGSLYCFASPRMAARVEVEVGKRFNVLNRITWVKPDPRCELNRGAARSGQANMESLRHWWPRTEAIVFAEHYGADSAAKGESGYQTRCDELRGFIFEPLRAYLDSERERAGVAKPQIDEAWRAWRKSRNGGMSSHWFSRSQWALPTAENYEWLRGTLSSLNGNGKYLRREYEDLRREYEDLRRPFSVNKDVPYTDVWTFPTVQAYPGKHPCEKPIEMMTHIVKASTQAGAAVLDPFMGSGTTLVAAKQLGRKCIGIEMEEKYCEIAAERLRQGVLFGAPEAVA